MELISFFYIFLFLAAFIVFISSSFVIESKRHLIKISPKKLIFIKVLFLLSFYSNTYAQEVYTYREYDLPRSDLFAADISNTDSQVYLTADSKTLSNINYVLLDNHGRSSYGPLEANARIDPKLNFAELGSLNSWAKTLMKEIKVCANTLSVRQWYSQWNFENCPDLKKDIDEFKLRVINFSLNSKFHAIPGQGMLSYNFVDEQTGLKSELDLESAPWVRYYHDTNWREDFEFDKGMLTGHFFEKDYFLSRHFKIKQKLKKSHYNPLLIQTLIEISSLQLSDTIKTPEQESKKLRDYFVNHSWWTQEPNFEKLTAILRIVDYINYGEMPSSEWKTLNQALPLHKDSPVLAYTSSTEQARHPRMIRTSKDDLPELWSHFPIKFKNAFIAAHNSIRILANLSFFVPPENFGIFPMASASYFATTLEAYKNDSLILAGPFSAILSRNLNSIYQTKACSNCETRDNYWRDRSRNRNIEAYRFYMKDLIPDLESLKLK